MNKPVEKLAIDKLKPVKEKVTSTHFSTSPLLKSEWGGWVIFSGDLD